MDLYGIEIEEYGGVVQDDWDEKMIFRLWIIDKCKLYNCEFGLDYKTIRKVTGSIYNKKVNSRTLELCCDR